VVMKLLLFFITDLVITLFWALLHMMV